MGWAPVQTEERPPMRIYDRRALDASIKHELRQRTSQGWTPRDADIIRRHKRGQSTRDIARAIGLSYPRVSSIIRACED